MVIYKSNVVIYIYQLGQHPSLSFYHCIKFTHMSLLLALHSGLKLTVAVSHVTGERLSLLVLRTAPGLGNVSVDWTVHGHLVHRTFTETSGTLFFTEVNTSWTSADTLELDVVLSVWVVEGVSHEDLVL